MPHASLEHYWKWSEIWRTTKKDLQIYYQNRVAGLYDQWIDWFIEQIN